jgi:hypothetical protein
VDPKRLPNGNLLIPRVVTDGAAIGDAMVEIGPDHSEWGYWDAFMREIEALAV